MAPLRLQIVVQPRVLPSPSGPTPTLPEPTIKWLEICPDNLTIQQLSERLEKRFFDRNHALADPVGDNRALNIKILKYLDDLDLFPEYRVGDIFEDINKSQASDKSYSTVKVYRNPPTREELLDPRRFESLPPNSLARPIKRPLPPLFAEATQHISSGLTDHGHPPRGYLPVQSQGRNKRQKVDAIGFQLYTDSDRPLDSLEDRPDVPLRNAHVRPSAITHVEDSQKKRRSFEPRKPTVSTRIHQGSDPYGTPISSQTGLHDVDKPLGNEVVYIPDSPVSVINAYSDDSSQPSSSEKLKRSRSPEIPTSNASSSVSQELQSQIPPVALLPPSDQQHQVQASANQRTSKPSPIVSIQVPPISQEPPVTHPDQVAVDNITKTPSPKQKEDVTQPGRLRRPKPKPPKQPPSSKVTHKTINGVRQTATSVYDPIETSEGSSHERELLRSAKRSKTSAVHEGPKSKVVQSELIRASSGARSLEPNVAQPKPISHPSSIATSGYAPFKPVLDPKTIQVQAFSPAAPTTIHDTGLSPGRPKQHEVSRKHSAGTSMQSERSSDLDSTSSTQEHQTNIEQAHQPTVASEKSQAATTKAGRRPVGLNQVLASDAGENSRGRSLKQQLDEAEENKRKAQAEFDRIAALQIEQKRLDEQTNQSAFEHSEESSFSNEVGKVAAPFAPVISNGSQQPLKAMSLEEQRAFNLKHVTPGLTKQLSGIIEKKALELQQEKDRQAAIEKQEQAARLEAHRQARLARVQASKDQEMAAQEKARDDKTAQQQRFQTQEVQGKQKLLTDQKQQEEQIKVSQGKSKLKQAQEPNKEEVVGNANAPARKRITKKTNAQHEDSPGTLPKYGSHKAQPVAKEDQTLNDGSPLASQNQAKVGDTASGQAATKVDRSHDQIDTSEGQSAAQQVVGEHSLDWLIQRSPKAIYNARLQLQLANKMLKHTKRDSTAVKTPRPASNLDPTILHDYNPASSHRAQLPAEKGSKQRQDVSKAVQQGNQSNKTFTDSEALRAAGIFARVPKNVSSGIGASDKGKSAISTLPSSSQSIRPKKVGPIFGSCD
ncbi:MAG: hypothetical protein L6R41_002230 [Letrouitia leprolyta]|nr:MAG: hypothetical protein L6R41_002230 [Letrouitia leprolyta]